ncbi:hypothetical protein OFN56_32515, partial [Escherichia coli]|nr:hypothetical protein [Escherichia coli]
MNGAAIRLLNGCDLIADVSPTGAAPVAGPITGKVTVVAGVPVFNGEPYLPRYFDIEPLTDANTATATITL